MAFASPLMSEAAAHLSPEEMQDVHDAYAMAKQIYGTEEEVSGEPLIIHVEKVARRLLKLHPDARTITTALLQEAQGKEHLALIEKRFGKKVTSAIAALAVLARGAERSALYSAAYLRKMTVALSEDIRVLLIFLHNRLHLLEQAEALAPKFRAALAREALDVFAPMAARLGVYALKYAFETLAFAVLFPEEFRDIEETLRRTREQQGSSVTDSARALKRLFAKEGKRVSTLGREKHPYSIFRKMERKGLSRMTDLHDLFGLRLLVETREDCYQALGVIHKTYRPILHRMKDYIAFPKPNGYQSLHTTILGLNVRNPTLPVEIQIRTHAMDEQAEYGVAAHWQYKEGRSAQVLQTSLWQKRTEELRKVSEAKGRRSNAETELTEVLSDRIYVLTPRGDPIELPKGATPLDFAFHVHTDVGLTFRAARVNGVIAPIDQPLENGDMVEILRQKDPKPSQQWLRFARTHEARSKIRVFFRMTKGDTRTIEQREGRRSVLPKRSKNTEQADAVELDTETPLPHRFAGCCAPHRSAATGAGLLPPILGFVTRNGMVNIHRRDCRMLREANRARQVKAGWRKVSS